MLQSRLGAMHKKLSLETKIRDAALSLSKANSSFKGVSKQSSEQLDAANRKVDTAQKEVWRISERVNDIQRRLLEHRASVLSYSVRSLEKKAAPGESDGDSSNLTSGYSSPSRSTQMSPTPSSMTSVLSSPSKGKFDGAHFFAGHTDAVVPRMPGTPMGGVAPQIVAELEEKLKAAEAALVQMKAKTGELGRDVAMLHLEKEQIETTLGMEVQAAEDTIRALEREAERMGGVDVQVKAFEEERELWMRDRVELEERRQEVDSLERRLEVLEERTAVTADIELRMESEREAHEVHRAEMERQAQDMEDERIMWEADKTAWEVERETMSQDLRALEAKLREATSGGGESQAQLDTAFDSLRDIIQTHGVLLVSRDGSLPAMAASVSAHLDGMDSKLLASARAQEEWAAIRAKLEEDIRMGLDKREALYGELDQVRRERDEAKTEARNMQADLQVSTHRLRGDTTI